MYTVKLAEYTFEFRDLTWLDEFNSSSHVEVLSRVIVRIHKGGVPVELTQAGAHTALMKLPQDIRDRMWKMYLAHLPKDREWSLYGDFWIPPEPKIVEIQELEPVEDEEGYE